MRWWLWDYLLTGWGNRRNAGIQRRVTVWSWCASGHASLKHFMMMCASAMETIVVTLKHFRKMAVPREMLKTHTLSTLQECYLSKQISVG